MKICVFLKLRQLETHNSQYYDFINGSQKVYSYVVNKFEGLQISSSLHPLHSVFLSVRPSGEVVLQPNVGADVPHAGHSPPEFTELPLKEGVVNSNYASWVSLSFL